MANKVKVKNPHGAVFIYNYRERFGDSYLADDPKYAGRPGYEVEQIILNSASLMSVHTQKGKNAPSGSFEIKLAPYKNWTSAITPGSWCIILMSNSAIDDGAKTGASKVKSKSFKMLGRIESVRGVVSTNQRDGSITKYYLVTGSDWGCVFDSSLYVDPLNRTPDETALGMAARFGYGEYLEQIANWQKPQTKETSKKEPVTKDADTAGALGNAKSAKESVAKTAQQKTQDAESKLTLTGQTEEAKKIEQLDAAASKKQAEQITKTNPDFIPTSIKNIKKLVELWGSNTDAANVNEATDKKLLGSAVNQFILPEEVARYMRLPSGMIADLIECQKYSGRLVGKDIYSGNSEPTDMGLIRFNTIFGEHNFWQVLQQNFNEVTSELVADVRFEGDNPQLVLYNRVKPFAISPSVDHVIKDDYYIQNNSTDGSARLTEVDAESKVDVVARNFSQFKNLRTIELSSDDVIMSSFGTNWRDKINFVEIQLDQSMIFNEEYSAAIKLDSQFYDSRSISRDGLRRLSMPTLYVPTNKEGSAPDPIAAFAYKYLLKEWFFNTHIMLNGTLNLVGQDKYIQVGDNIKINAKVLDINRNFNIDQKNTSGQTAVYLLAHVESIGHTMEYERNGRVFHTIVNFVRGILVDENLNPLGKFNRALDQDAALITPANEVNSRMSGSSAFTDPDSQKLGLAPEDVGGTSNIDSTNDNIDD